MAYPNQSTAHVLGNLSNAVQPVRSRLCSLEERLNFALTAAQDLLQRQTSLADRVLGGAPTAGGAGSKEDRPASELGRLESFAEMLVGTLGQVSEQLGRLESL